MDLYLRDVPDEWVELMDQGVRREITFNTGLVPKAQTVAQRRNEQLKAFIKNRADAEKEATAKYRITFQGDVAFDAPVDLLITRQRFPGNEVEVVISKTDAGRMEHWLNRQHRIDYERLH